MNGSDEEITRYNRAAWDEQVNRGNRWTKPVSSEVIVRARQGQWDVVLTPSKPVPRHWFPSVKGLRILCLASGGGQQAPVLAAAGARVTALDNSPRQLEQDQLVATREGLSIESHLGDMRDLSVLADAAFDLVFNPCSVSFIPDVQPMFEEAYRVLRPGGRLMCGFVNPLRFVFDETRLAQRQLQVRHRLPYTDQSHLSAAELEKLRADCEPFVFSHSLEDLIAGQLRAGFRLLDLFEDSSPNEVLTEFICDSFATLAQKPDPPEVS